MKYPQTEESKNAVAEYEIQDKKIVKELDKAKSEFMNGFDANHSYTSYDSAFEIPEYIKDYKNSMNI